MTMKYDKTLSQVLEKRDKINKELFNKNVCEQAKYIRKLVSLFSKSKTSISNLDI